MKVTVIGQNQLHFLGEGLGQLRFLGLREAADEIVGVELRDSFDPADFAEIVEDVVWDMLESHFAPLLYLLQCLFQLLNDGLLNHIFLLPLLAYLREHPK